MEGSESLLTVFKPVCDKVNILKLNIEFLKCIKNNKPESLKIIKKIEDRVSAMVNDVKELQNLLKKQKTLSEEMKVEEIEISHLLYKLDALLAQQSTAVENTEDSDCQISNAGITSEHVESMPYSGVSAESTSCVELSPLQFDNAFDPCRKNLKQQSLAFDIPYLTTEEYKLVPKYMVGRLTLEAINKFIDVINDALSRKYNILSKTVSALKNQEQILYRKYKCQQVWELKAKHFITEEDIAREYNKPVLEKKAYNFLTILRHTKRLLRSVVEGNAVYIVTSEQMS